MTLPSEVARIADNYNHLFEQPTLFYAIAISIAVLVMVIKRLSLAPGRL